MRIALEGELDIATVPILSEHLRLCDDSVTGIMIDLRKLTFLDSSGLHAFVAARDRAAGNGSVFAVVGVGQRLRRLFALTETKSFIEGPEVIGVLRQFTASSLTKTSGRMSLGTHVDA